MENSYTIIKTQFTIKSFHVCGEILLLGCVGSVEIYNWHINQFIRNIYFEEENDFGNHIINIFSMNSSIFICQTRSGKVYFVNEKPIFMINLENESFTKICSCKNNNIFKIFSSYNEMLQIHYTNIDNEKIELLERKLISLEVDEPINILKFYLQDLFIGYESGIILIFDEMKNSKKIIYKPTNEEIDPLISIEICMINESVYIFCGYYSTKINIFLYDNEITKISCLNNACAEIKKGICSMNYISFKDEELEEYNLLATGSYDYRFRLYQISSPETIKFLGSNNINYLIHQVQFITKENHLYLLIASEQNLFYIYLII